MTPERWQKIKEVLADALEVPPADVSAHLDRSCAGDPLLRREVELLIDRERRLGSHFLNETSFAEVAAALLPAEENPWLGRRVGAYKTVEQIGAGGMGEVYRAFRADDQYRKDVALKVVRAGQDSGFIIARFKNERQILASLDHPNIARLLDGGSTEEGSHYLVMELIEGKPVGEYCDAHRLSITARLELFLQVCRAVQYAHQRLIIHRDIKPSNILVTVDGTPKLLDFGIAKMLSPVEVRANETMTGLRILTPGYASPEQIKGEPVTTGTDVYSLGVVLYELLVGRSPYRVAGGNTQELIAAICEQEPERPSVAVRRRPSAQDGAAHVSSEQISANRDTSPARLYRRLKGDLDTIVLMALRKEPSRRYASVEQFGEDIRKSLAMLPVAAQKDTVRYRAAKFVRRHKGGVAAALAVTATLVAGLVITVREARIAERRFNDVRSLANSLIFDVHDSIRDLPGSTPAKKIIIDRALQYLNTLAKESAGDVGLQRELAAAYERVGAVQGDYLENNLGDSAGTLASYERALEIRKQVDSSSRDWHDRLALAQGYRLVAHQQWVTGKMHEARENIGRAIEIAEGLNRLQPNDPKIIYEVGFDHEVSGAIAYPGDPLSVQKVIEDFRKALATDEFLLKLQPDDLRVLHGYATDLSELGRVTEALDPQAALANYQKALEIDRRLTQLSTDPHYERGVAISYGQIASVYDDIGDYGNVVENNMKGLAIYQDLVRTDPKNALLRQGLAIAYVNTSTALARVGKLGTAIDYSGEGVEIMRAQVAGSPQNARQQRVLAAMLAARGRILTTANKPEAAIAELESARSIYESLYKTGVLDKRANVAASDVKIGEAEAQAGRDQAAAENFHRALEIAEPLIARQTPDLDSLYAAADAYFGLGELSRKKAQRSSGSGEQRKADWREARSWYLQSQNTWNRIDHPNHTAPNSFEVGDPKIVARELKVAEAALSGSK